MFPVSDSVMILDRSANPLSGVKAALGVQCRAVCPGCSSLYKLSSKLYTAQHIDAAVSNSLRDVCSQVVCEVCGLKSAMLPQAAARVAREARSYRVPSVNVPTWSRGPGALHGVVLLEATLGATKKLVHVLLRENLPTLRVLLHAYCRIPSVSVERPVVCDVCSLRSLRTAEIELVLHHEPEAIAKSLASNFDRSIACTCCGAVLQLQEEERTSFETWITKQLDPERVAVKLKRLRVDRAKSIQQELTDLHKLAASKCERPLNLCWRTHGQGLEQQVLRLKHELRLLGYS